MERLKERLTVARRALATLNELCALPSPSKVERDAAIQRFKYTFEATWKAGRQHLKDVEGLEAASPKAVVRVSLQAGVLDETKARQALEMVDDRDLTSHTYNEELAEAIFGRIPTYATLMQDWLSGLEQQALGR